MSVSVLAQPAHVFSTESTHVKSNAEPMQPTAPPTRQQTPQQTPQQTTPPAPTRPQLQPEKPASTFGALLNYVTLPVIKKLDRYIGQWQSIDLKSPAVTEHLWTLAENGTDTLRQMAQASNDPVALWDQTVDRLETTQIQAINAALNTLVDGDHTRQSDLIKSLPFPVQHLITAQRAALKNNLSFHFGHLLFNSFSTQWQKRLLKQLPKPLKKTLIGQLKADFFEQGKLRPLFAPDTTLGDTGALTNTAARAQAPSPHAALAADTSHCPVVLTDTDIKTLAPQLWTLAADLLEAARGTEPDPNHIMAAHQDTIVVPTDTKIARVRTVLKDHLPVLERVLSQPNLLEALDKLCIAGELPDTIRQLFHQTLTQFDNGQNLTQTALHRMVANLSPLLTDGDKHLLIDALPTAEITALMDQVNQALSNLDPYQELPFYKEFADSLSASIRIKPVRLVAEKLTRHYFQGLKNYPEFQRELSVAILRLGPYASKKHRISAIAQAASLGFQKAMQLFSKDIRDPEIRALWRFSYRWARQ